MRNINCVTSIFTWVALQGYLITSLEKYSIKIYMVSYNIKYLPMARSQEANSAVDLATVFLIINSKLLYDHFTPWRERYYNQISRLRHTVLHRESVRVSIVLRLPDQIKIIILIST